MELKLTARGRKPRYLTRFNIVIYCTIHSLTSIITFKIMSRGGRKLVKATCTTDKKTIVLQSYMMFVHHVTLPTYSNPDARSQPKRLLETRPDSSILAYTMASMISLRLRCMIITPLKRYNIVHRSPPATQIRSSSGMTPILSKKAMARKS